MCRTFLGAIPFGLPITDGGMKSVLPTENYQPYKNLIGKTEI
jgi:hypothetical protein